jgi:predicted transcriptional regulator|tara:strand:+ start:448 stop:753 length:306 start_codon:yes stop_codon:yes gene_type:complete
MPFEKGNKIGNRFKEGEVNNPNGRRNAARDILNKILDTEVDERTKRERLLDKLVNMAHHGNLNAIKEVLDRTEGKSTEYIVTEEVNPIRILDFGDDILDEK